MSAFKPSYVPKGWARGSELQIHTPRIKGVVIATLSERSFQRPYGDYTPLADDTYCIHIVQSDIEPLKEWFKWWMDDPEATIRW